MILDDSVDQRKKPQVSSKDTVLNKIETILGLPINSLQAVVCYSDRSYTNVVIFGPEILKQHFVFGYSQEEIVVKPISALLEVPYLGENVVFSKVDATEYGLKSGQILLIQEMPV